MKAQWEVEHVQQKCIHHCAADKLISMDQMERKYKDLQEMHSVPVHLVLDRSYHEGLMKQVHCPPAD